MAAPTLLALLMAASPPAPAQPVVGKQAWTQARVSGGLHRLDQAAAVIHQPAQKTVPAGAVITQVQAQRDYAGQADVRTSLCWNGTDRCVDLTGLSVNTRAFNGLDAGRPMYLVHRVAGWRDSRPPLFVKGSVTVWYGVPGPAAPSGGATR